MPARQSEQVLRYAIAFVWVATAALVLHPDYRAIGNAYLARMGLDSWWMVAACTCELALGLYLIVTRRMSWWLATGQTLAIAGFTVSLAVLEPALLVHYLGILTKNLPLVACIWTCWLLAEEDWSRRSIWVLRGGMAVIWITEGILPKMIFLQAGEVAALSSFGLSAELAADVIFVTGLCQAISGVAALLLRGRPLRVLLFAQGLALIFLPLMISACQAHMWLHPFGPLTKNIPILVGTAVLWRRCGSTSS